MHWRRVVGLGTAALLIIAAIVWGFMPRPVRVDTAAVARGQMTVTVEEEGRTRVIDRYVVSAPVAGYAQRIELRVGDSVAQGQTVVALEPLRAQVLDPRSRAEAQARVGAANSALLAAQQATHVASAEAEIANREYQRLKTLCQKAEACVSEEAVDQAFSRKQRAEAELRSSHFNVDVTRHELEAAETALKYSAAQVRADPLEQVAIHAPVAGRVLKVFRESEGVVNPGEPLLELGDPAALEVAVDVLSADAVKIKPGTPVFFERWGGDGAVEGVVGVVEPTGFTKISALGVEEQRVWVIADITSPYAQWQRLGDGYRVEASFVIWQSVQTLQVPNSALFRRGDRWSVFVVEGDHARERAVEIGQRNGLMAEVLGGLDEGERVIVHPSDAVDDGVAVEARSR